MVLLAELPQEQLVVASLTRIFLTMDDLVIDDLIDALELLLYDPQIFVLLHMFCVFA